MLTSWAIRVTTGLALLWLVGYVLTGLALWRSGAVPRVAAVTLTLSAAAVIVLAGPLLPVLGPLSTLSLSAGYASVGTATTLLDSTPFTRLINVPGQYSQSNASAFL